MSGIVAGRLAALGITLPGAAAPAANYVPYVRIGDQVHLAGQISKGADGKLITGKLGDLSVDEGKEAAKQSIISFIATLNAATNGNLDRIKKIVKINVFINSTSDFTSQSMVANGASDLLVQVFGEEVGCHARSAVGVAQLPFGVAVEIDGFVQLHEEIGGNKSSL